MKINFSASLPDIQSALSVGGTGARLKLDVPETDLAEIIKMVMVKGKLLRVTVEVEDDG